MCAGLMCLGLFWRGVVGFFSLQITLVGSWQLQPCESGLELAAWLLCQQQQHAMLLPMLMLPLPLTLLMVVVVTKQFFSFVKKEELTKNWNERYSTVPPLSRETARRS